tara:strand:+ start:63 stop:665 length:603 start_codon:yes stop_codon:yes gene_type:complete
MSESEYKIFNNKNKLIVCFGGLALKMDEILPFEFLNYLSSIYTDCDLLFYIDKNQCWYHKGIHGITNNIHYTILYLDKIIKDGNYEKVIFMGTSAGGYASILFGSLCDNVNNVISFIPQTILNNPINLKYSNLKNIINKNTKYIIYGDTSIQNKNDNHHILHCENIGCFPNVKIIKNNGLHMKQLRDNGSLKKIIDDCVF